jgi:hypothetical protein
MRHRALGRHAGASVVVAVAAALLAGVMASAATAAPAPPAATTATSAGATPSDPIPNPSTGEYPPLGYAVQTISAGCGGIAIGTTCYNDNGQDPTPAGDVNVVVLNYNVDSNTTSSSAPQVVYPASGTDDGVALWSCASNTCTSPLENVLEQFQNGYLVIVSQPANYADLGESCPSAPSSSLHIQCPGQSEPGWTIQPLSQLVPPLTWNQTLYQPWSAVYSPNCGNCPVALNLGNTLGRTGQEADLAPGGLSGSLQLDQSNNLAYTSTDFVPYDTQDPSAPAGTDEMTIDGRVLGSVTPGAGQSGFMVAELNRGDLSLVTFDTFVTNGNPRGDIDYGEKPMANFLQSMVADPAHPLVMIQSFGTPSPETQTVTCQGNTCFEDGSFTCGGSNCATGSYLGPTWAEIGEAIHDLGGTMSEFDALNDSLKDQLNGQVQCSESQTCSSGSPEYGPQRFCGGYAFVGGVGVANPYEVFGNQVQGVTGSCPQISGPPALLQGVLTRDLGSGLFEPYMSSALPSGINASLFELAYPAPDQQVTPFKMYSGNKENAFNALVGAINAHGMRVSPLLRPSYWQDVRPSDWSYNAKQLEGFNCGSLPAADDCDGVRNQLLKEFSDVKLVYQTFANANSFLNKSTLWAALGTSASPTLEVLADKIIQATTITPSTSTLAEVLGIISAIFSGGATIAGALGPEGAAVGAGLGSIGAAFGIAGTIVGSDQSSDEPYSPFEGQIETTIGNLAPVLQSLFTSTASRILAMGEIFTTDWGRLKAMAKLIKGGAFTVNNDQVTAAMAAGMDNSAVQLVYESVVPDAYGAGVGYDYDQGSDIPYAVEVGSALPGPLPPLGCYLSNLGGFTFDKYNSATLPSSGPVLASPSGGTLTTLMPQVTWWLTEQNHGNPCTSAPSWLGEALFKPAGGSTKVPGSCSPSDPTCKDTLTDGGISYQSFFEHAVQTCFMQLSGDSVKFPCQDNTSWPSYGTLQ